jgi:hypothetical protein
MTDYERSNYRNQFDLSVCSARAGRHLSSPTGIPSEYVDDELPRLAAEMSTALRWYASGENGDRARQALDVFENFCNVGGAK